MALPLIRNLTARQVNLLLAVALVGVFTTGLTSWAVGTGWSRWWTAAHAAFGFLLLVLAPKKAGGSVSTGLRRKNPGRWMSIGFGICVLAIIVFGLLHSTGLWIGVGYWSPLWTHFLLAFAIIPLALWHVLSRPSRVRRVDLDRRLLVGGATAVGVAAAAVAVTEGLIRVAGARGADRRFTGSHEVASFDPSSMPTVSWIDDSTPSRPVEGWTINVDGDRVPVAGMADRAMTLDATLDCTGGWFSEQSWQVVAIADLIETDRRSFEVVSATGYRRRFPMADAQNTYVAVGYAGMALRRGHGAPARIVAPSRRGPWWVKWVVSIETSDRPWWVQFPFPLT